MLDWHVIIPVVWAIVSSVLALFLYRTSSAFFEQETANTAGVQRIRLVGSIVIAGAIFGALRWATPPILVTGLSDDSVIVSKAALTATSSTIQDAKNVLDKLTTCSDIARPQKSPKECEADIKELQRLIETLGRDLP